MKHLLIISISLLTVFGCEKEIKDVKTSVPKTAKVESQTIGIGELIEGLRVYSISDLKSGKLQAFRGDYVKIKVNGTERDQFIIDSLNISHTFPKDESGKAYFKLKKVGIFSYSFGDINGKIEIKEYNQPNYKLVSAEEGAKIINNITPLILDVRTPGEFASGHLENATLIPVQIIQNDYTKIENHKDKPIFIYCASGNRSTVASRILIDKGFKNIYNLKSGISGWSRAGYKIVK